MSEKKHWEKIETWMRTWFGPIGIWIPLIVICGILSHGLNTPARGLGSIEQEIRGLAKETKENRERFLREMKDAKALLVMSMMSGTRFDFEEVADKFGVDETIRRLQK